MNLTPLSVLCDDISAALAELTLDYTSMTFSLKISCLTISLSVPWGSLGF